MQTIPATPLPGGESGVDAPTQPPRRRRRAGHNGSALGLVAEPQGGRPAGVDADIVRLHSGPRSRPRGLTAGFVARPRLVEPLLEDQEASLVLIAAAAGYGKTSLLCEWDERDQRSFAWVTATDGDNDPAHLLGSIGLAVEELEPADRRAISSLAASRADPASTVIPRLLRTIGAVRGGMVLVVDDVQLLRSPDSLAMLALLSGAMPAGTKLALASRTLPAIPLGRLRAQHAVLGLGVRELAMTRAEAGELLRAAGLKIDADALGRLLGRTEGWPAGLYLAALSLRNQTDAERALERFAGSDQLVSEYIREEMLAAFAPELLTFLMRTSILESLSAEVCDAVLGENGSGEILRTLAAANLLVRPLDEHHSRYRCHPLLRDVLRAELTRVERARIATLHRRAGRWFADHGDIEQAVSHDVAGGDTRHAGELLWGQVPSCLMRGRNTTTQRWLSMFTAAQIASSAPLALSAAYSHLAMGDLPNARHWANAALEARRPRPRTRAGAPLEAAIAIVHAVAAPHGIARAGEEAERADELLHTSSPWRAICFMLRGVSQHLAGERAEARQLLREGSVRGAVAAPYVEALCLSQLSLIAAEDEDWEDATDIAERAGSQLERDHLSQEPASAIVFATSAWIFAQQGRADQAKRALRHSAQLLEMLGEFTPWFEVETRVLQARAAIRLADVTQARALLSQASRLARRTPEDLPIFRSWFDDAWGEIDAHGAAALSGPSSLTIAELRILRFLPTHLSFREIGCRLHVSTNTVKSQAHAVYRKLDAESRSEAVERASAIGLIDVCVI